MKRLILGTAGHIDHGKTALVKALTGVDTDRLKEEKARGITIELGFAGLQLEDAHFGVVDVPGHEAFVRAMVAGAAGMDLVLLVVAADEGVMPQTREHLAIVELLGVRRLVVALTKADTVDEEWMELVHADVVETLSGTPFAGSEVVATSARTGAGLEELRTALARAAADVETRRDDDLFRLPVDRAFTVQGTGTVVTGTVWSGTLSRGERVRILPAGVEGRVRALEVHGEAVDRASAGHRAAVALAGGPGKADVPRGSTLVSWDVWRPSRMLTTRIRMLPDAPRPLVHNQRVRVHVGTAEVLARVADLGGGGVAPGGVGWVQLRLEEPAVARGGDRVVIRAYSPVTTIGGGEVAESHGPKRRRLTPEAADALDRFLGGDVRARLDALTSLAGWEGVEEAELPVRLGASPDAVWSAVQNALRGGALRAGSRIVHADVARAACQRLLEAVDAAHREDPLRDAVSPARLRSAFPAWAPRELPTAVVDHVVASGALRRVEGGVRRPHHEVRLEPRVREAAERLEALIREAGLAAPFVEELTERLTGVGDPWPLLKYLEGRGVLTAVADGYFVATDVLAEAIARVRETLAGRSGLGPADFREALPLTRRHLIPLLNHLDGLGVTVRTAEGRSVPRSPGAA